MHYFDILKVFRAWFLGMNIDKLKKYLKVGINVLSLYFFS